MYRIRTPQCGVYNVGTYTYFRCSFSSHFVSNLTKYISLPSQSDRMSITQDFYHAHEGSDSRSNSNLYENIVSELDSCWSYDLVHERYKYWYVEPHQFLSQSSSCNRVSTPYSSIHNEGTPCLLDVWLPVPDIVLVYRCLRPRNVLRQHCCCCQCPCAPWSFSCMYIRPDCNGPTELMRE